MLRVTSASLCTYCQRMRLLLPPPSVSTVTTTNRRPENQRTTDCLYELSVDIRKSFRLSKRVISKLMASAPQSFSRPVERNQEVIHTVRETYLDLGGDENNLRIWLQKLLSQNPYILTRPAETWRDSLGFLREQGFATEELLSLVSSLRASISELQPLNVLELITQIVLCHIQKLASYGYDVRSSSLDVIVGTKKDFEMSYSRVHLRQQRPLFNPVAPLSLLRSDRQNID